MSDTKNITLQSNNSQNTYDETPYHSYPYPQSQPDHLRAMGMIFGMNPPELKKARVLELGCAEGGNIIPHAVNYPNSEFIGVDLSKVQIEAGQKHLKSLGLKNIQLKHVSITDVNEKEYGKFDYIICHGVMSWVPKEVREKIFDIASKQLTPNGVAYISYNTLPGWNTVRTIRDMMLYHAEGFQAPQDKVSQSRLLLKFVKDSLEGQNTPYANFMKQEFDLLSNQSDHYLRHDHLEEDNKQFYFNEFMKEAGNRGLQYLSDTSIASMYVGNMPKVAAEKLQTVNDIVKTEQYMDYITNRRFRSTLLCHKEVKLNRNLNADLIKKFRMTFNITPDPEEVKKGTDNNDVMKFYYNNDKENFISSSSPILKAVLIVFSENNNTPLSFDEVVDIANKKLKGSQKENIAKELLANAMQLVIKGYMQLSLLAPASKKPDLKKPKVTKLAYYQATETPNNWVTNPMHNAVGVNAFDKFAIKYMDGKHTKEQIVDQLVGEINDGKITIQKDGKAIENKDDVKKHIEAFMDNTILRLSQQSLFENK